MNKSREDSFDRLTEENTQQFADDFKSVDEQVEKKIMIEKLRKILPMLSSDEQQIIRELFFNYKTERKLSAETGIPQKTINNRKHKILAKLKIIWLTPLTQRQIE